MSDMGGSGEGAEVGGVQVSVGADTGTAEQDIQSLFNRIQALGQQLLSGGSQTGFVAFGTTASQAVQGVTSNVNMLANAMGPNSPMAAVQGPLNAVALGFNQIAAAEARAEAEGRNWLGLMPLMQGAGAVFLGLGGAASRFAQPLQDATAAWQTAVTNTGKSVEDYQGQLNSAVSAGKQFGFNAADVTQALSQLTAETRNPDEALKELTFTETLAAATHQDLASAARQAGQIHAGMYRSLRQFGIQLPQIRNDTAQLAADETKLAAAGQKVADSQTRLAQYQAEVTQRMQADQEKYALAVEDDTQRVADAKQRLADLEDRLADRGSQHQLDAMSMADAEMRVNAAKVKVATTSGQAQQSAIEELRAAQEGLTRTQLQQSDQQKADARELATAHLGVSTSTQKLAKDQQSLADSQNPTLAQQAKLKTLSEDVVKAQEAQGRAQQKVTDIKNTQARLDAGFAKAEQLFMDREQGLLQRRASTWTGHLRTLRAQLESFLQEFSSKYAPALMGAGGIMMTIGTIGQIGRGIRGPRRTPGEPTPVTPAEGEAGAGAEAGAGVAEGEAAAAAAAPGAEAAAGGLAGVTGAAEGLGAVAPEIAGVTTAAEGLGAVAPEIAGVGGALAGVGETAGPLASLAASGGPFTLIIAAVVALGVGAYELYQHWKPFHELVDAIGRAIRDNLLAQFHSLIDVIHIIGDVLGGHWSKAWADAKKLLTDLGKTFVGEFVRLIGEGISKLAPLVWQGIQALPGLFVQSLTGMGDLLVSLMGDAWNFLTGELPTIISNALEWFAGVAPQIAGVMGDMGHWLIVKGVELIAGFFKGILQADLLIFNFFTSLGANILKLIVKADTWLLDAGGKVLKGLWNGMLTGWSDIVKFWGGFPDTMLNLLVNVDTWLVDTGTTILEGLWSGITSAWNFGWRFFTDLPHWMSEALKAIEGGPLKWLEGVGEDIINGVIAGIKKVGPSLLDALKSTVVDAPQNFVNHLLGRHSPSTVYAAIGHDMSEGLAVGIRRNGASPMAAMGGVHQMLRDQRIEVPAISASLQRIVGSPRATAAGPQSVGPYAGPESAAASGAVVKHWEPHFHQEIDPQHVLHEFEWDSSR